MMIRELSQAEFDDLSAWADGELDAERSAEVARLVEQDPAWAQAYSDMKGLEAMLDACQAPPAAPDLAERVIAAVRRASRRAVILRVAGWGGAVAAAAAVLLAVALSHPSRPRPAARGPDVAADTLNEAQRSAVFQAAAPADRAELENLAVKHLDFWRDYDVVQDFETLKAIDRLESDRADPAENEGT